MNVQPGTDGLRARPSGMQSRGTNAGAQGGAQAFDQLLDVGNLLRILRRRMWVLIGVVILIVSGVVAWTMAQTPLYTAETRVMIGGPEENVIDIQAVLANAAQGEGALATQIEVIRSREFARRVVQELDLADDPEFNSALVQKDPLIPEGWNPMPFVRAQVLEPLGLADNPEGNPSPSANVPTEPDQDPGIARAVGTYLSRLETQSVRSTPILAVRFTSADPRKAAAVANTTAELYLLEQLEMKFDATRRATQWLETRLADLRDEVEEAESAVTEYRNQHDLIAAAGVNAVEGQVADINAQIIGLRAERAEKQARLSRVREIARTGGNLEALADISGAGAIADLRSKRRELERREADLSTRYGDRHPDIINVRAEQRSVEAAIQNEIDRVIASLENDLNLVSGRLNALTQSRDQAQEELRGQQRSLVRLQELERNANAARSLYQTFLERFKETEIQEDRLQPDGHVLSRATVPGGPSFPNMNINVAAALVLASMLGLGAVFLVERLDNGLRVSREVENLLGVPVLSSIPRVGRGDAPHDMIVGKSLSAFAESMRGLRMGMMMSDVDRPPKVMLVTSALPGEGKTTLSACMARSSALAGARTILIDCDLRRPSVHKTFGFEPKAGIVEVLSQRATLEEAVVRDRATELDLVGVRNGAPNPSDLLGSRSMHDLLERLRGEYDLIVLDSAPALAVTDARVLATQADASVFVVRWDRTPRDAASTGLRSVGELGGFVAGAVLNDVDVRRQRKYGKGDYYSYYQQYRSYYAE